MGASMSQSSALRVPANDLDYVVAQINYTRPGGPKPASYLYEAPPGVEQVHERNQAHQVAIYDARPLLHTWSLDVQGFGYVRGTTSVRNFNDTGEVKAKYDAEV